MKILDYFCTEGQAATLLNVNRITILRWVRVGRFNIQRVGNVIFIPKGELDIIKAKGSRIGNGNE